jgi:hypothetical protein
VKRKYPLRRPCEDIANSLFDCQKQGDRHIEERRQRKQEPKRRTKKEVVLLYEAGLDIRSRLLQLLSDRSVRFPAALSGRAHLNGIERLR